MKRYTLPELLSGAKNGTVTLDGEYVLYSDLIAAGCLVPVPVGEACLWNELSEYSKFVHDGGLFVCNGGSFILLFGGHLPKRITPTTIVQPVRLVPLAELEAES